MKMTKKLKYGLIGCGGCGVEKHLESYSKMKDNVELWAVCDIVEEKAKEAAARYNVPNVFTDYKQLLALDEIDIVSVATPNYLHSPITVDALMSGKHVHCEKPIAMNFEEALKMMDARDKSGKLLMIGLNNRFTMNSVFAKKYIEDGNLGEIYHIKCGWRRRRGIPGKGGWFTNKAMSGGGPLIDLGVHMMDLSLYLAGSPKPVSVVGSTYSKFADSTTKTDSVNSGFGEALEDGIYDVEDLGVGFVKFDNKMSMALEFSWASNIEQENIYYELYGTKAGIRASFLGSWKFEIFSEYADQVVDIIPKIEDISAWGENETRHFIDCVKNGKKPIAVPEQAADIIRIIMGLYQSSDTGKEVIFG
jgi:predicted dehydrogenase